MGLDDLKIPGPELVEDRGDPLEAAAGIRNRRRRRPRRFVFDYFLSARKCLLDIGARRAQPNLTPTSNFAALREMARCGCRR